MTIEIVESKEQKEKLLKKNEQSPVDLWDIIKQTNIIILGVYPEGEERGGRENT